MFQSFLFWNLPANKETETPTPPKWDCFNPSYSGICPPTSFLISVSQLLTGFQSFLFWNLPANICGRFFYVFTAAVSILLILEFARQLQHDLFFMYAWICFNPSYSGICPPTYSLKFARLRYGLFQSFLFWNLPANPFHHCQRSFFFSFQSFLFWNLPANPKQHNFLLYDRQVSILLILEFARQLGGDWEPLLCLSGFNPSYSGICPPTQAAFGTASSEAIVSILLILEFARQHGLQCHTATHRLLFQSFLFWNLPANLRQIDLGRAQCLVSILLILEFARQHGRHNVALCGLEFVSILLILEFARQLGRKGVSRVAQWQFQSFLFWNLPANTLQ